MECRPGCGACCIFPSISSPIPGMPDGKPAFVRCTHLTEDFLCDIFNHHDRPKVCHGFKPEIEICGTNPKEAEQNFRWLLE
jgi:uncharacterized protein